MSYPTLRVPLALLREPELTPAAKLIWLVLRLDATRETLESDRELSPSTCGQASQLLIRRRSWPTHLARRTGLARSTVYDAIEQLAAAGWCVVGQRNRRCVSAIEPQELHSSAGPGPKYVFFPWDLVESSLRPHSILAYGFLQALPTFRSGQGHFKWAQTRDVFGWHPRTVKRAVRALEDAGWITIDQKNRLAALSFTLQHADIALLRAVQARLGMAEFKGQALMLEYLTLIVDSNRFVDDGSVGFLVNPRTKHLLEFDRFYPLHGVAFEFNGRQHYVATGRFSSQQVEAQRNRDATKRLICTRENINLVVVHAEDLTLEGMLHKVGELLPRRNLSNYPRTIQYLERISRGYREAASAAQAAEAS